MLLRAGLAVLDVDADVAGARLEHVLRRHADVRRLEQAPGELVLLAVAEADLLGTDADGDAAAAPVERTARDVHLVAVVEPNALGPGDGAGQQVRDAEEAG